MWMRTIQGKTYLRRFCTRIASNLLLKQNKGSSDNAFLVWFVQERCCVILINQFILKRPWPFNGMFVKKLIYIQCRNECVCFKLKVLETYLPFMAFYFNYIFQIISRLSVQLRWRRAFSAHTCSHYCSSIFNNI